MADSGSSPTTWLHAELERTRTLARRLPSLLARAQPSARALGRALTVRGAPARLVYAWLAGAWVAQSLAVVARLGRLEHASADVEAGALREELAGGALDEELVLGELEIHA